MVKEGQDIMGSNCLKGASGKVMRMVRWMRGIKLKDRVPSKGLTERLGLDDIISVLQQNRLQ